MASITKIGISSSLEVGASSNLGDIEAYLDIVLAIIIGPASF